MYHLVVGDLALIGPFFQEIISYGNSNTHTRYPLYTLVSTLFFQIELSLRDLNFYSDGTPSKEGMP